MSTGFKIQNLFYLIYGFVYLSVIQVSLSYDPFYYPLLILIDGLSPLVYLTLIVSLFYVSKLAITKKKRTDILLLFLIIAFVVLTISQGRAGSRHLVIIMPLIPILISRCLTHLRKTFRKKRLKNTVMFFMIFIIFSAGAWSVKEISKDVNYTVWRDLGDYVNNNVKKDKKIFAIFPYWPLYATIPEGHGNSYYVSRRVFHSEEILQLNAGDVFILGDFSRESVLLEQEPFKGDIDILGFKIFKRVKKQPYPAIEKFVKKNGDLIEVFSYKGKPAVWLYEIKGFRNEELEELVKEKWSIFDSEEKKDQFFIYSCKKLKNFSYLTNKILPEKIIQRINQKCSIYDT